MTEGASLPGMAAYFLRLGALGFGGPVALAHSMRRDLVESRGWITEGEYDTGLAIAAACPGPLAYQLGVYCGFVRHGIAGGLAVALAFALAPFLLVLAVAAAYTRFAGSAWLRALFYGVGPVVVALILKACWGLGRKTLRREPHAWGFALVACAVTAVLQRELTELFLAAGALGTWVFARDGQRRPPAPVDPPRALGALVLPLAALAGAPAPAAAQLFAFFFKTGCLVFGSGLVIVPFLKTYVVDQYHWLGNREFLDSVAIGMISPGPVVITATFVGYLVGGLRGAVAATVGIFTPAVLFTVVAAPLLQRYGSSRRVQGLTRGITVTVVGVLLGTTYLVGRSTIGDAPTAVIAALALASVSYWRTLPEPLLVACGAAAGLLTYPSAGADWLTR